ncbi:MAG: DUF1640 domain-containing protein [Nitrospirae bacterium]|nr:DUF1640 domain-containing protein [Nitrospirota bacterium]
MAVITIPRALREKLGEEGTGAFVEVMQSIETEWRKDLSTKEDLARLEGVIKEELANFKGIVKEDSARLEGVLKEELVIFKGIMSEDFAKFKGVMSENFADFKGEIRKDSANFKGMMSEDFAKFKGEVREDLTNVRLEIEKAKSDVIKWVAAMLIAQSAVIAALVRLLSH